MKNEEKYRTLNERQKAFQEYCSRYSCPFCKYLNNRNNNRNCAIAWLADEAEEVKSVNEVIADFKKKHLFYKFKRTCLACVYSQIGFYSGSPTLECHHPDLIGRYANDYVGRCAIDDVEGCVCNAFKAKGTDK